MLTYVFRKRGRFLRQKPIKKWRIVRGDKVEVINGLKDVGKQGVVQRVDRRTNRVVVTGVNLVRKHVSGSNEYRGTIVTKPSSVHISNVMLVHPETGKPTKTGILFGEDGKKVRVARGSDTPIPKPPAPERMRREAGKRDTPGDVAIKQTLVLTEAAE